MIVNMLLGSWLLGGLALAAPAAPPPVVDALEPPPPSTGVLSDGEAPPGIRIVVRGVGEMWHDTAIASTYRGGGLVAGLGAVVPITDWLGVDAEIGYHRASADGEGRLQLVPMSLLAEASLQPSPDHDLSLFGGLGPAMVAWSESGQDPTTLSEDGSELGPSVLRGARPGLEVRVGMRVDLDLIEPSLMPGRDEPLKAVELEISGGRRFAPTSSGFDLNTWRVGAGLALVF